MISAAACFHLALKHTNLYSLYQPNPHDASLSLINSRLQLHVEILDPEDVRHPTPGSIWLEFLPQHILVSLLCVFSLSTFCPPPLKGCLFVRRNPPLLSLSVTRCQQNSQSLRHHVTNARVDYYRKQKAH